MAAPALHLLHHRRKAPRARESCRVSYVATGWDYLHRPAVHLVNYIWQSLIVLIAFATFLIWEILVARLGSAPHASDNS